MVIYSFVGLKLKLGMEMEMELELELVLLVLVQTFVDIVGSACVASLSPLWFLEARIPSPVPYE